LLENKVESAIFLTFLAEFITHITKTKSDKKRLVGFGVVFLKTRKIVVFLVGKES